MAVRVLIEPLDDVEDCTITCRCGSVFRGRHAIRRRGSELCIVMDRPCPACGKATPFSASSDPETFTLTEPPDRMREI